MTRDWGDESTPGETPRLIGAARRRVGGLGWVRSRNLREGPTLPAP